MPSKLLVGPAPDSFLLATVTTRSGTSEHEIPLGLWGSTDPRDGGDVVKRCCRDTIRYVVQSLEEALHPGSATDPRVQAWPGLLVLPPPTVLDDKGPVPIEGAIYRVSEVVAVMTELIHP